MRRLPPPWRPTRPSWWRHARVAGTTYGVLFAVENLVNSATPPSIISQSYGECEAINGAASNLAFKTAFQTGAAAGTSDLCFFWRCRGIGLRATLYRWLIVAYPGIGITGWGETVYNVSVGGTDFEDAYNAKELPVPIPINTYWNATNTATDGSAKSYIPEIPWNDSCSGYLLYNYLGAATGYGTTGECASATFRSSAAGAGGPSSCATGGGGADQTGYCDCRRYVRGICQTLVAVRHLLGILPTAFAIFPMCRSLHRTASGDITSPSASLTRPMGERPARVRRIPGQDSAERLPRRR